MKKTIASILALFAVSVSANAITLNFASSGYVGSIADGIPPSDANEFSWVNTLIDQALGTTVNNVAPGSETLIRSNNAFPATDATGGVKEEAIQSGNNRAKQAGDTWILGKYGNSNPEGQIIFVWYIGDIANGELLDIADDGDFKGLSHSTIFGGGGDTSVPDNGVTLILFGSALAGLGLLRRRLS